MGVHVACTAGNRDRWYQEVVALAAPVRRCDLPIAAPALLHRHHDERERPALSATGPLARRVTKHPTRHPTPGEAS